MKKLIALVKFWFLGLFDKDKHEHSENCECGKHSEERDDFFGGQEFRPELGKTWKSELEATQSKKMNLHPIRNKNVLRCTDGRFKSKKR